MKLPDDWRVRLAAIRHPEPASAIAKRLSMSSRELIEHERMNSEFRRQLFRVRKFPITPSIDAGMERFEDMSSDEIDDLLLMSIGLNLNGIAHVTVLRLRDAIRQLRKEKRELASEINRLKHAEQLRRSGGTPSTHQSGNGTTAPSHG
jgi:hypothetical protein